MCFSSHTHLFGYEITSNNSIKCNFVCFYRPVGVIVRPEEVESFIRNRRGEETSGRKEDH